MNFIRQLDFFTKAKEDVETSTGIGGLFSIVSFAIGVLLFILEFSSFLHVDWIREMEIENESVTRKELVDIDINFYRLPCQLVSVHRVEEEGAFDGEVHLNTQRINSNGKFIADYIRNPAVEGTPQFIQSITDAINQNEGCRVYGVVNISEIPGHLEFGFKSKVRYYQALSNELKSRVAPAFRINHLSIGSSDASEIYALYGKKNNFSAYDGIEMRNLGHNERANLFIKLVSNKYYQDSKKPPLRAHQFSLNSNRKIIDYNELPSLTLAYEFSPITINYYRHVNSFARFIVDILAIIGGVFAVMGMINSYVLSKSKYLRTH